MTALEGYYYDGLRPVAEPARMEWTGSEAVLSAGEVSGRYRMDQLTVSPAIGAADRFIDLPDGGQFQCPPHAVLDSLPQESRSEGPVAWLEARWQVALTGVVLVACVLLAGYFYGLPFAAERVAARIPLETEAPLGRHALAWLDKREWFKPSHLGEARQQEIRHGFDRLRSDLPHGDRYQLELRASRVFRENAFALPGGIIVMTDEMVLAADTTEEVLAVLAHEIGHEELRHTMRSVLQNSAVGIAVAAVTSDAASLSVAVAGLPVLMAQTKYSRDFESAADEFAFTLLKEQGYSPDAFAALMERLNAKHGRGSAFEFVSTHPVTEDRVKRARDAARE